MGTRIHRPRPSNETKAADFAKRIDLSCDTRNAAPRNAIMVASVATKGCSRTLVTSRPLMSPATIPTAAALASAATLPW